MAASDDDAIRHILLRDWDPVGIGGNPNLSDEYDGYVRIIQDFLPTASDENAIVQKLVNLTSEYISRDVVDKEACRTAAQALVALSKTQQG